MAQDALTISISTSWKPEEPTGELCFVCGDACYLKQTRLMIAYGSHNHEPSRFVICGSCGDERITSCQQPQNTTAPTDPENHGQKSSGSHATPNTEHGIKHPSGETCEP